MVHTRYNDLGFLFSMKFDFASQYGFSSTTTSFSHPTSEALVALKCLNSKIGQAGGEGGPIGGGDDPQENLDLNQIAQQD